MRASQSVLKKALLICITALSFITASAQLNADFSATPLSGCSPLLVSFTDLSSGNIGSKNKWYFGDGIIANNIQNPSHIYIATGNYAVKLVITNGTNSDSVVKTGYIQVHDKPTVDFSVSTISGCYPLNVDFKDKSTANSGSITNWTWDFGDGTQFDTTQNPSHTYDLAGTFGVTLVVTNSFGCSNSLTKTSLIKVNPGVNANFDATARSVCGVPVTYDFNNTTTGAGTISYVWTFSDIGTQYTTTNPPPHTYNTAGSYQVRLKATSSNGCWDTVIQKITVGAVQPDFDAPDTICSNQEAQFKNTSNPTPLTAIWDFADGTLDSTLNPLKTFTKAGTYNVKLVDIFSGGCSDSISKKITVITGPAASFKTNDTANCAIPFTVHFQNTTTGTAVAYLWDFGDGKTDTVKNPVHIYNNLGAYTVKLTVINSNGCQDVFIINNYINIGSLRIKGFVGLPDSACIPETIQPGLLLNMVQNITSYKWNFGDGTTSTAANPVHLYSTEGVYKVSVSITTADGCSAYYGDDSAVMVGHKPKANFTVDPTSACASGMFTFYNNSTNGPIHYQSWSYGSGSFRDITPYQHITQWRDLGYDTGYLNVRLIVWNYGCSDTIRKDSIIYVKPPIAQIHLKNNCDNKLTINFGDSSLGDVTWKWTFGDGSKPDSINQNPAHTYPSVGTYTVQLITHNKECSDTSERIVDIVDELATSILDSISCRNQKTTLTLQNVNASNIKSTYWDFGNGRTLTEDGITTTVTYGNAATYRVNAVYTDILGCKDTIQAIHRVYGPRVDFTSIEPGACQNGTVHFKDTSATDGIHKIVSWTWDYGDKVVTYNAPPFAHVYKDTGIYTVQEYVTDSYGCSDSLIKNNFIHVTHPYAFFSVSDTLVCPGKQVNFKDSSSGVGLQYNWIFGDGNTSVKTNPVYLYTVPGIYTPQLFITDVNNCVDSAKSSPIIVSSPAAKFNMSDSFSTCPPLSVAFKNLSSNYISYTWDFGDGSTSTQLNPTHIYTYPGVYPVRLLLQGNGSCQDSVIKKVTIQGPTGSFSYNPLVICAPDSVYFKATAKNTAIYTWDFSDGLTISSISNSQTHVYDTGMFVPKLILDDGRGCKVAIPGQDTIKVFKVKALASLQNFILCDSGYVIYKDSSLANDRIVKFDWDFGDGLTSTKSQGTHFYSGSGNYNIRYIATSENGCMDTLVLQPAISVVESPSILISGDSTGCSPASLLFSGNFAKPDTSAITWNWNYGNGNTGTGQSPPPVVFNNAGKYKITLIATDANGCKDTSYRFVTVNPAPPVDAGSDAVICKNASLTLDPSGAVTYTWNTSPFLSCTNCQNPIATPDTTTIFTVTGKDAIGCSATDSITVKISPPIQIIATGSDTLCIGSSAKLQASGAKIFKWFPATYLDNPNSDQPIFKATKDTLITYKVVGTDDKNCYSDTATVSMKVYPVPQMEILQKDITLGAGNSVILATKNSADVTAWKWEPPTYLNSPNIPNPTATPLENITYTCAAVNGGGCLARSEIHITVVCDGTNIFIPNTFSPNNDGVNDKFYVRGNGLFSIKSFRIFNRWGQLVYSKQDASPNIATDGWDGTYNGQKLSSDVYVYMIEVLCVNKTIIPVKGNITLLR